MGRTDNLVLFVDSDCDITLKQANKLGVNLIIMPYTIDGKEIKPYIDYEDFNSKEYYGLLRDGVMPKTGALSPIDYVKYFEPFFKEGKDILYVHFSSAMSGTFNSMHIAYEQLLDSYPDRKLYEIDTKGITINSYGLAMELIDKYNNGDSIEELLEFGNKENDKWATYFYVESLDFFRRSGRVKSLSAFMGNIIGIKPIIYFDNDGLMNPYTKVRGIMAANNKLVDFMEEIGDNIKDHKVIIGHTDSIDNVNLLKEKIIERFGDSLDIEIVDINPTIGCHCGPGGVGVCFHAKHR